MLRTISYYLRYRLKTLCWVSSVNVSSRRNSAFVWNISCMPSTHTIIGTLVNSHLYRVIEEISWVVLSVDRCRFTPSPPQQWQTSHLLLPPVVETERPATDDVSSIFPSVCPTRPRSCPNSTHLALPVVGIEYFCKQFIFLVYELFLVTDVTSKF